MRQHAASITDLPVSPADDQRRRLVLYAVLMGVRMLCLVVFFFVPDWWKLLPAIGAIFIPYLAVTLANATGALGTKSERVVQRQLESGE